MRLVFVFIFFSTFAFGQNKINESVDSLVLNKNSLNGNNISLSIGSALLANGLGLKYERLIPRKKVYYTLTGGAHFFRIDFFGAEDHSIVYISNGLITGLNKPNHFEASLGLGWDMGDFESAPGSGYNAIVPVLNIGYRFQRPNKSLVFRSGIGVPEFLYVSLGHSF